MTSRQTRLRDEYSAEVTERVARAPSPASLPALTRFLSNN